MPHEHDLRWLRVCINLHKLARGWRSLPELKSTMALRQLYSAESTCRALSFSTCSWKMRMWSMNATTRSAAIGLAWSPAAASSGATWSGIEHCAAFSMNSSLHDSRSNPTWSVTCRQTTSTHYISLYYVHYIPRTCFICLMINIACMAKYNQSINQSINQNWFIHSVILIMPLKKQRHKLWIVTLQLVPYNKA